MGKIGDVNVITDGSTIFGVIVVSEHREMRTTIDSYLSEVGEKVVGDSEGIFAESTGDVGSRWIEVAQ